MRSLASLLVPWEWRVRERGVVRWLFVCKIEWKESHDIAAKAPMRVGSFREILDGGRDVLMGRR